ncbi:MULTISPECIES: ATP-dependent nuclease [Niastella]|uniref:AAA family ATPase n=1 Tax=Niastella soli TaxID=2821487 RepID=A0ABS3YQR3_9BACT|nr:ATP-binding protein [Niastella soli]MBO9200237.1 AAA family ATPase [Niastella soli]
MKLKQLEIKSRFKNLVDFVIDFSNRSGTTVLIGNNGSGKSNILEAISSIFAGLYDRRFNPSFNYSIDYEINNYDVSITYEDGEYDFRVNGNAENIRNEYLPSQVICSYSGEENRIWKKYYWPFYEEYIKAIRGATLPNSRMVYVNKYYWNIALLILHFHDFDVFTDIRDFCQKTLAINTIKQIKFTFDTDKIRDYLKNPNPITAFISAINPNSDEVVPMSLNDFKGQTNHLNEKDLFRYLAASFMPKDDKLITKIDFVYNNSLDSDDLSEGEKKFLLLVLILEVVADENSLILLDEPDSHIHLSRKEDIRSLICKYVNRENIITTHSPTLTHNFDLKHIVMLTKKQNNDAQIESKEKQEIVYELTKGIWSYQEQNIFLSSQNDILLVEGKSDETFIRKALEVLQQSNPRYSNLRFEFLPCGGADGVKLVISKFKPAFGQHIIALFDADKAGWDSINKIFERQRNPYNNTNFGKYRTKDSVYVAVFPKRKFYRGDDNFNIEDYFSKQLLTKYVLDTFKNLSSIVTKDHLKRKLERECNSFPDDEFKHFSILFDLLLEIKSKPSIVQQQQPNTHVNTQIIAANAAQTP